MGTGPHSLKLATSSRQSPISRVEVSGAPPRSLLQLIWDPKPTASLPRLQSRLQDARRWASRPDRSRRAEPLSSGPSGAAPTHGREMAAAPSPGGDHYCAAMGGSDPLRRTEQHSFLNSQAAAYRKHMGESSSIPRERTKKSVSYLALCEGKIILVRIANQKPECDPRSGSAELHGRHNERQHLGDCDRDERNSHEKKRQYRHLWKSFCGLPVSQEKNRRC